MAKRVTFMSQARSTGGAPVTILSGKTHAFAETMRFGADLERMKRAQHALDGAIGSWQM